MTDSDTRLRNIEVQQATMIGLLEGLNEKMEDASKWRSSIDTALNGDEGYRIRVDRLEQAQIRQKKITGPVVVGMALLILAKLASVLGFSST